LKGIVYDLFLNPVGRPTFAIVVDPAIVTPSAC